MPTKTLVDRRRIHPLSAEEWKQSRFAADLVQDSLGLASIP